jgi:hypothetical protein
LTSLGAAAVALPFFPLLERSALGAPPPLRFACFIDPHGTKLEHWRPQGTETNFSITYPNAILAPFAPLQKKILVLDGISLMPAKQNVQYLGHKGYVAAFTGCGPDVVNQPAQSQATTPSIDQYLAGKIGGQTALRSIELASGETNGYKSTISWSTTVTNGYCATVPRINNPYDAYNFIFGNFDPGSAQQANAAHLLAVRKSRLDYVQDDLARLEKRLPSAEQSKLQEHLQSIRDIETQLSAMANTTASCTKPSAPTIGSIPMTGTLSPGATPVDGDIRNSMVDMLATAFACDRTRVASFQMGSSDDVRALPYADPLLTSSALENGDMHLTAHDQFSLPNGPLQIAACHRYFASVVARFASALDAIPEGNGTVLDHTCILWIGSMMNAAIHDNFNVPCMLIGGANGAFTTGRYLQVAPDSTGTMPHNHLLVSILNAFGLPDQTFGSSMYSGPLSGLA